MLMFLGLYIFKSSCKKLNVSIDPDCGSLSLHFIPSSFPTMNSWLSLCTINPRSTDSLDGIHSPSHGEMFLLSCFEVSVNHQTTNGIVLTRPDKQTELHTLDGHAGCELDVEICSLLLTSGCCSIKYSWQHRGRENTCVCMCVHVKSHHGYTDLLHRSDCWWR